MTNDTTAPLIRLVLVVTGISALLSVLILVHFSRTMKLGPPAKAPVSAMTELARDLTPVPKAPRPTPPPRPMWIWADGESRSGQEVVFRRTMTVSDPVTRVTMRYTGDNHATIVVNDTAIDASDEWTRARSVDLTPHANQPDLTIEVRARNDGGPAGFIAVVEIESPSGDVQTIVTDSQWHSAFTPEFIDARPAVELEAHGGSTWGIIAGLTTEDIDRNIEALPGYEVELVYTVPHEQGSWVSLTHDAQGRLIASDQRNGLYRITPSPLGKPASSTRVESIDLPIGAAQGLLCLDDDLYVVVAGPNADGEGLYRVRDTNDDDHYDDVQLVRLFNNGGEHGPHAIVEGPDGMLYIVAGNHTRIPDPESSVVPRNWDEDHLLPRLWDSGGHAVGILAPGGWVCRMDREGSQFELFAIGFRNPYDIAFNRDGELFAYDADMEWDLGAPWYRPTRINHVVSGAEFGWRSGSAKWPDTYADSLPAVLDIGPGSPTGVSFGYDTHFPPRYREALFALDWTFGTIYSVHLVADGATYRAEHEPFVTGRPLPVADITANPTDGALYFVVGGRGVPSALYRVRYTGQPIPIADRTRQDAGAAELRAMRRRMESYHQSDASIEAIDDIWRSLGHADRFIAYSARVALEHQPVERWIDRALTEQSAATRLNAILAVARWADVSRRSDVIDVLSSISYSELSEWERLVWLRCWALTLIRLGPTTPDESRHIASLLEPIYPSGDDAVDRELCTLLVRLQSPVVVARTLPLMESARPQTKVDESLLSRNDTYGSVILKMAQSSPAQAAVHYALALSHAEQGWTPSLRERYVEWFESGRRTHGGRSFGGFLDRIRTTMLDRVPIEEREHLEQLVTRATETLPVPEGPGRVWQVEDLLERAERLHARNFENGARMYEAARCAQCHRFAGTGVMGGPDLTAVATRYTPRDLLESIIEPSRTISDQYQNTMFVLEDDSLIIGRAVQRDGEIVRVMASLLTPDQTIDIPTTRIVGEEPSLVSPMMPGLIDPLNADEVLDLLAYLLAEGDSRNPMFIGSN